MPPQAEWSATRKPTGCCNGLTSPHGFTLSRRSCSSAQSQTIPRGLYHLAQGCEGRATLGESTERGPQPCKGCITSRPAQSRRHAAPGEGERCNPFRVEHASGTQPRVARGSQPLYVLFCVL